MRVAPWHQSNWDGRAAGNFIGGGSGTGLLLFAALTSTTGDSYRITAVVALALIGAGLSCVWAEIGRPWRALNVFRHAQTSWMTREAILAPFLFGAGLLAVWQGGGIYAGIAALLGMLFLYSQARMLAASRGIPLWREPKVIPLLIATACVEGAALGTLLAVVLPGSGAPRWFAAVVLVALILRRVALRAYRGALEASGAPNEALAVLRSFAARFDVFGQVVPELLLVGAVFASGAVFAWLVAIAGLIAALSGWALKFTIVARAAYNQGFALPMLPIRGQGEPMPGTKPGWSK